MTEPITVWLTLCFCIFFWYLGNVIHQFSDIYPLKGNKCNSLGDWDLSQRNVSPISLLDLDFWTEDLGHWKQTCIPEEAGKSHSELAVFSITGALLTFRIAKLALFLWTVKLLLGICMVIKFNICMVHFWDLIWANVYHHLHTNEGSVSHDCRISFVQQTGWQSWTSPVTVSRKQVGHNRLKVVRFCSIQ